MGQQHRVRIKRKRRRAYLERRREATKVVSPSITKTKAKKQAAIVE